jgi:EmrB/QacA subfamily drug resistance transporter
MAKKRAGAVLGLTGAASFMVALDALVVSTALSAIRTDLHASIAQLEWTVNAYVLSFAVLMMTASALGDRLGRRRLFAAGLGVFGGASALCALAPDVAWLIVGRTVQGVGAAFVMPLALALLGTAYPPERRAWAMGIYSSVTGVAVLCGPLLGGAVLQAISWQWIFWLNVPLAAVLIVGAALLVDESFGARTSLDLRGVTLVTGAALGVVWGLVRGGSVGWRSAEVVGSLVTGVVLAVAFARAELRYHAPMLPLRLFRSRAFSAGNAAIVFWSASVTGTLFFMAQFLQTAQGYGPLETGVRLTPWGLTTFLVPQLAGRLMRRYGERWFVAGGMLLQAGCMAWIAATASPTMPYWQLAVPLTLSGTGFALAIPAIQSAVIGSVAREHLGQASGALSTVRQFGAVIGVAVLAAVFAGTGGYGSAQAFSDGFTAAIAASGVLALAGAVAGVALPAVRRAVVRPSTATPAPQAA